MKLSKKPLDAAWLALFDTGEMQHVHYLITSGERPSLLQLVAKPLRESIRRIFESGRGENASEYESTKHFLYWAETTAKYLDSSKGRSLEKDEALDLADNLQRAWEVFRANASSYRMYHDLPMELVKQVKISKRQSEKAKGERSELTPAINKLAVMKDVLGDYLLPRDLWNMFAGELSKMKLELKEVNPKDWKERKYVFVGGQYKFTSFKVAIAKARKKVLA